MKRISEILIAPRLSLRLPEQPQRNPSQVPGEPATCSRPITMSLAGLFWTMRRRTTAGSLLSQPPPSAVRVR